MEKMKDLYWRMAYADSVRRSCAHAARGGATGTLIKDLKRGGAMNISLKEVPPTKCPDHDIPMII